MGLKPTQIELLYKSIGGSHLLSLDEKAMLLQISKIEMRRVLEKTTICAIKLDNTFEIVGVSHCASIENFSDQLGRLYALKDALDKLGSFLVFHQHEEVTKS